MVEEVRAARTRLAGGVARVGLGQVAEVGAERDRIVARHALDNLVAVHRASAASTGTRDLSASELCANGCLHVLVEARLAGEQ